MNVEHQCTLFMHTSTHIVCVCVVIQLAIIDNNKYNDNNNNMRIIIYILMFYYSLLYPKIKVE